MSFFANLIEILRNLWLQLDAGRAAMKSTCPLTK